MLAAVRACPALLIVLATACRPSATVENTMPVANLQPYRTMALRVRSTAFAAQGWASYLETSVAARLKTSCQFDFIGGAYTPNPDVVLDLNITRAGRGSNGWVTSSGTAVMETLVVLSDGHDGELLGTARIRGESSGVIINNRPPENEAVEVVAKSIADLLAKSGCSGPRVARAEPAVATVPQTGSAAGSGSDSGTATGSGDGAGSNGSTDTGPTTPAVDPAKRAQAEALKESGIEKLRGDNLTGALADLQQALALVPEPRYQYNICLVYEAMKKWDDAIGACNKVRTMKPDARLSGQVDRRLELLADAKKKQR